MTEKNVVTAIHDTLHEQMAADERMVVLGEDVGARGGVFRVTQGFLEEFGEQRVIDTPLAEGAIVGVAVGMALHPVTNEIWVSQHERDNIPPDHENLPPEEINVLRDGGDYGWPYCHSDRVPNPEYRDQARCDVTIAPALQMQAHSAPLGMTFLTGATHFPAEMRGDLLLAFHGSWNRDVPTGAKVMRIRVANDRPVSYEDFVWGFQRPDGSRWGRPTDVAVWRDGSVLVSEDLGGGIYRVSR